MFCCFLTKPKKNIEDIKLSDHNKKKLDLYDQCLLNNFNDTTFREKEKFYEKIQQLFFFINARTQHNQLIILFITKVKELETQIDDEFEIKFFSHIIIQIINSIIDINCLK